MYLNRQNRESVIGLLVQNAIYIQFMEHEEKYKELFGPEGWKYFKTSRTFLIKSLDQLAENIGQEQIDKLHNVARQSDFVVASRFAPKDRTKATIGVDVEALYDLASLAAAKECTGCTKQDYKKCHVFKVLQSTDIPAAQEVKKDCCYRQ
jgi:TfoX/Sxy family transcriptional regulator of competence genes